MLTRIAIVGFLLLAGCGGVEDLDPRFDGTWSGTATASIQGMQPISYQAKVSLLVTGESFKLEGACPDGSGAVSGKGKMWSASWTGNLDCAPMALGGCGAVVFTYESGSLTLHNDRSALTASVKGTGNGCGTSHPFTMTFEGAR